MIIPKSKLKIGDILKCNDGRYYIYARTDLGPRFLSNDGWLRVSDFNEKLNLTSNREYWGNIFDFIEVYRISNYFTNHISESSGHLYPVVKFDTLLSDLNFQQSFINLKYYV